MAVSNECYNKLVQNNSVGFLAGVGAAVVYNKKYSSKKTKYRGLKTFGIYLAGNLVGHNLMNVINTPPANCSLTSALGIDTTGNTSTLPSTTNTAMLNTGTSPTGSPLAGLSNTCGSCRSRY
jgi:hypothetical protein